VLERPFQYDSIEIIDSAFYLYEAVIGQREKNPGERKVKVNETETETNLAPKMRTWKNLTKFWWISKN